MTTTTHRTKPYTHVMGVDDGKLFAVEGTISEEIKNLTPPAGNIVLTGTPVPDGWIYVITAASCFNNTTAPSRAFIEAMVSSVAVTLGFKLAPAIAERVTIAQWVVLYPGDYVYAYLFGTVAGDDLYFRYCGYKMRIP